MQTDLEGRRVLVTGAQQGIGRATALALARAGADVALNWLDDKSGAEAAAADIHALGRRALLVQGSVASNSEAQRIVEEADTIRTCRRLAKHGFLFGGSTGTVVFAAINWLKQHNANSLTAVAISPDLGERYVDTIYNNEWVQDHFGNGIFETGLSSAGRLTNA